MICGAARPLLRCSPRKTCRAHGARRFRARPHFELPARGPAMTHTQRIAQAVGSAGEHVVQARLLVRGWIVGNVNSGGGVDAPPRQIFTPRSPPKLRLAPQTTG